MKWRRTKTNHTLEFLVKRSDETVVLKTLNAEIVKLSRRGIGAWRGSTTSIMPTGILQALTAKEARFFWLFRVRSSERERTFFFANWNKQVFPGFKEED
jgi:hypothetical protein